MSKLAEIEALLFVAGEEGIRKIGPKIPGGYRYESLFDGDSFPL